MSNVTRGWFEDSEGKAIVVILPDSGERCPSTALVEGLFDEEGFAT
ncbi:hypothetical protein [Sorangium sp. So ce887]